MKNYLVTTKKTQGIYKIIIESCQKHLTKISKNKGTINLIYLNSVKLRLVLGVFTFVFGWGGNWSNTKQFWSVPFVSEKKRMKYLRVVEKDLRRDCKK